MSHDFKGLRAPEQCVRNILLRKFDSRPRLSRIESFDDSSVVALRRCTRIIDKLPEQADGCDGRDRAALFFRQRRDYDTEGRWIADPGKAQ